MSNASLAELLLASQEVYEPKSSHLQNRQIFLALGADVSFIVLIFINNFPFQLNFEVKAIRGRHTVHIGIYFKMPHICEKGSCVMLTPLIFA